MSKNSNQTIHSDIAARDKLVQLGLLRCEDLGDLRIYNYTNKCTHSASWNEITINSRGIILNTVTGEVVAQPMPKFFNLGEREETMDKNLPWISEDYLVFEKMDGWLGILYRYEGKHCIATRGSFVGMVTTGPFAGMRVATWATKFLNDNYDLSGLPDEVTLVFEIICPATKIIVDYGNREDLVLLTAYNRYSGEEYDWSQITTWAEQFGFSLPRVFGSDINECKRILNDYAGTELEGFVVRFNNGLRVKIKTEDYMRRAAIISNLTPLAIWKAIYAGTLTIEGQGNWRDLIDADYIDLFNQLTESLRNQYYKIKDEINQEFARLCEDFPKCNPISSEDRKNFALKLQSQDIKHKAVMFSMLDKKDESVHQYILKQIRPSDNKLVKI